MNKQKILIADDSDLVREFIGTLLTETGYEVEVAENGVDAILKTYEFIPDLIVMDVEMPVMKGYQACRFIKTNPQISDIPVIIHTTKDEDINRFWGYSTGADGYVTKNFDNTDELLDVIQKTLEDFKNKRPSVELVKGLYSYEEVLTEVNDLLDRELFSTTIIAELSEIANNIASPSETIEKVFTLLSKILNFDMGGFYIDRKSEGLLISFEKKSDNNLHKNFVNAVKPHLKKYIPDIGRKKIRINRIKKETAAVSTENQEIQTLWIEPITSMAMKTGILVLASAKKNGFTEEQILTIKKIYIQAAILIYNAILYNDIKKLEAKTRNIFEKYVPKEVIKNFLGADTESLLSGERRSVAILFSDIREFTTMSERMSPEMVVNMLNHYFSRMVAAITKNKGTIDKFIGDAILAIFGAPNTYSDSSYKSITAALDMIEQLHELNKENVRNGTDEIQIGIGIHYGDAIVGNIGSIEKMDYTVIGDTVNLASRLEGLTKYYGVDLIISEYVVIELAEKTEEFLIVEIDTVRVKGKEKPTVIYTIFREENVNPDLYRNIEIFEKAYMLYRLGNFNEAKNKFEDMDDLYIIKSLYLMRCSQFIEALPEKWDGVYDIGIK